MPSLPLSERKFDYFFAVAFTLFIFTSGISDCIHALGTELSPNHTNLLVRLNYQYGAACDPLFLAKPFWLRMATGISGFVYGPFYILLVYAMIKGKNWIRLPAVIYASALIFVNIVVIFTEFFGELELRCSNPIIYLAFNLPYTIIPLILLVRMRNPNPFLKKF